jgi:hypothetical protein
MKKVLFLCIVLAACAKKSNNDNPPAGKTILGIWTKVVPQQDNNGDNVFENDGSDCDFDDAWNFTSNGNLKVSDGILSCDPDYPVDLTTPWHLAENDTRLVLGDSFESYYFIELLEPNKMILHTLDDNGIQQPEKFILTR